jgi:translin
MRFGGRERCQGPGGGVAFETLLQGRGASRRVEHLARIAARLEAEMDRKDALREEALLRCRRILRGSTGAVRALHQGEEPGPAIEQAVGEAKELSALLARDPEVAAAGFVEEALQELAEAAVVHAILRGKPVPEPEDLHCPPLPYVLGLGDAVGELRRAALDALRSGKLEEAEGLLRWMDALFDALMRFDQPVAGPVRRKQDVARGLVEKTRGELAVAMRGRTLEESIKGILDEVEAGRAKTKKRAKPRPELDLDVESEFRQNRGS